MEHEFIYYVHDSSETFDDNFTVVANDTALRKLSLPKTVYVQVTPVNDQPPVITSNKVLRVSAPGPIFKLQLWHQVSLLNMVHVGDSGTGQGWLAGWLAGWLGGENPSYVD